MDRSTRWGLAIMPALGMLLAQVFGPAMGTEAPTCRGLVATIIGSQAPDRIVGTVGRDVILGGAGDDLIITRGGIDVVCGGAGNDRVRGRVSTED
jgi:Ca2+-binding RTX toxin-like protein